MLLGFFHSTAPARRRLISTTLGIHAQKTASISARGWVRRTLRSDQSGSLLAARARAWLADPPVLYATRIELERRWYFAHQDLFIALLVCDREGELDRIARVVALGGMQEFGVISVLCFTLVLYWHDALLLPLLRILHSTSNPKLTQRRNLVHLDRLLTLKNAHEMYMPKLRPYGQLP
jgi:hypothetical protein